jgi:hypothetical protein
MNTDSSLKAASKKTRQLSVRPQLPILLKRGAAAAWTETAAWQMKKKISGFLEKNVSRSPPLQGDQMSL